MANRKSNLDVRCAATLLGCITLSAQVYGADASMFSDEWEQVKPSSGAAITVNQDSGIDGFPQSKASQRVVGHRELPEILNDAGEIDLSQPRSDGWNRNQGQRITIKFGASGGAHSLTADGDVHDLWTHKLTPGTSLSLDSYGVIKGIDARSASLGSRDFDPLGFLDSQATLSSGGGKPPVIQGSIWAANVNTLNTIMHSKVSFVSAATAISISDPAINISE